LDSTNSVKMSQDIISDALNQIMNARRVEKTEVLLKKKSKLLIELFKMMKKDGHIEFKEDGNTIVVKILNLNECRAIKPRYYVTVDEIDKYLRRFLPSRNFGIIAISTSQGLLNQEKAYEKKIGGSLIAYYY
jgi:small subunit ribosomal protein S8